MKPFEYATVLSTINSSSVRSISLNRPDSLNAMNRQLIDDVAQAFDDANADDQTSVIILTGQGRAFCAGDDRSKPSHPATEAQARDLVEAIQRATRAIIFGEKPVIGAINGWAVGGGFEWAINCDFPIWAKTARAFFPEVSLNLFVTGAVTSLLPALAGLNKAREMLMLGNQYDATELERIGVAWRVVDDDELLDEAQSVARQLSQQPPLAMKAMKRVLNQSAVNDINQALELETEATIRGFLDQETTERLKNF